MYTHCAVLQHIFAYCLDALKGTTFLAEACQIHATAHSSSDFIPTTSSLSH